jgi:hypothetical protein
LSLGNPPCACSSLRAISARANSCKDLGSAKRIQETPLRITTRTHLRYLNTNLLDSIMRCKRRVLLCLNETQSRIGYGCAIWATWAIWPYPCLTCLTAIAIVSIVSGFVKIHCLQLHLLLQVFQHLLFLFFGLAWWDDEKRIKIYWDILRYIKMIPRQSKTLRYISSVFACRFWSKKQVGFGLHPHAWMHTQKVRKSRLVHTVRTHKHTHTAVHIVFQSTVYPPFVGDSPFQLLCQCCSLTVRFKKLWIEHHGGHGVQKRGQNHLW